MSPCPLLRSYSLVFISIVHIFVIINIIITFNGTYGSLAVIGGGGVVSGGETCRRKDVNGNDEVFECPRLFESNKKRFCCGFTPQDKHC
ncbi:unnamed protein product, partial [Oppiella nova]